MDDVITQLKSWGIEFVIDVRSAPYSRYQPEFSKDSLAARLVQAGLQYGYMGHQLGGRPDDPTCYTENGNVDYDKYRGRPFFREGISRLKQACDQGYRVCLICSEGTPKSCHRSALIGVALDDIGVEVVHLLPSGDSKSQGDVMLDRTGGQLSLRDQTSVKFHAKQSKLGSDAVRVFTIGGYGFDEQLFFETLQQSDIDLLLDIRQRAGMRGSKYAFLNKSRLQESIYDMGKEYRHIRHLAPSTEIRDLQKSEDLSGGTLKRDRTELSPEFVAAYQGQVLSEFDTESFSESLESVESIAFFCVEQYPKACHRSIVAARVAEYYGVDVEDLMPCGS